MLLLFSSIKYSLKTRRRGICRFSYSQSELGETSIWRLSPMKFPRNSLLPTRNNVTCWISTIRERKESWKNILRVEVRRNIASFVKFTKERESKNVRILGSNTRSRRIRLWHNFWSVHLLHRGKESFEGQRQTPLSPNYCKDLSFATKPQFAGSWHPPLLPPWLDNIYIVVGGGQKERGRRDLLARRDTGIVSSPGLTGVSC